jgi:phosphate transport system permease protein
VARISGETAPLLLTIFGASAVNLSVNEGPISALPVFVFSHLKLGTDNAVARAWTGALVLMVLVLVLFSVARWFGGRKSR